MLVADISNLFKKSNFRWSWLRDPSQMSQLIIDPTADLSMRETMLASLSS